MRRHSKASSPATTERKPSGQGGSSPGRIRLAVLLATVAAFLLVPAAQALANGTLTVNVEGTGNGMVTSAGTEYPGTPPIECSYASPGPATGTCSDEMSSASEPLSFQNEKEEVVTSEEAVTMIALAAPGYKLSGWIVEEGVHVACGTITACVIGSESPGANAEVTAVFVPKVKFKLTVAKTGAGSGTVESIPAGINCGATCSAEYEEGKKVTLTVTTAEGSEFSGWSGACSGTGTCKVTMTAAKSVTAEFTSASKNYPLTVTKTGAGSGTVTSSPSGINCGGTCTAEFVEGSKVSLTPSATAGSEFREWAGACSGTGSCEVTMSEAKSVNAFFSVERPVLTVEKSGAGSVSSKPKGIKCATTCSLAKARFIKNTPVEVKTSEGVTWATGAGTCTGAATVCSVEMNEAHLLVASFPAGKALVNPQVLTLTKGGSNGQGTVKAAGLTCEAACTETTASYFGGTEGPKAKPATTVELKAAAAFGSTFTGWSNCPTPEGAVCKASMNEGRTIAATFSLAPTKTLTLLKSGNGSVSSKPKGIKCGTACSEAVAALPEGTLVEIKTTEGVTWTTGAGTCTGSATVCTVTLTANTKLVAEFAPGKAIVNPKVLTLNKAGTGYGTVKATGLTCEALCTSTSASYFGGTEGPKAKAAAIVTLTAIPQAGSQLTEWVNCPTVEGLVCKAQMNEAHTITAKFDE